MINQPQIVPVENLAQNALGSRPLINKKTGQVIIQNDRGLVMNSILRKDEWKELDDAVIQASRSRLNGVRILRERGLTKRLGGMGTLISQWHQASEMTPANVNMTGQSRGEQDQIDFNLAGVPVPVIFKDYGFGKRTLEAGRRMGNQLDTSNAFAASIVVAESLESMLFNGSPVSLNGTNIYGLTNHPSRNTDTAGNYGGGDWGTATNIKSTIIGMMAAAAAAGFHGPYGVFVANNQYFQTLESISGTDETPLARVMALPGIEFVKPSDWLADGAVLLVQLTPDVVDIAIAEDIMTVEWVAGDTMSVNFKVLTIAVPRVKAEYAGKSGVVHATGA